MAWQPDVIVPLMCRIGAEEIVASQNLRLIHQNVRCLHQNHRQREMQRDGGEVGCDGGIQRGRG